MTAVPLKRLQSQLVLAFGLTLSPDAFAAGPGNGETLRVQDYPGIGNALVRVAQAKGYCERHGIRCKLHQLPNGALGLQAFLAGDLEVAFTGPETAYQAIVKGADLKVVAGGYAPQPFLVAVAPDVPLPNASRGYPALMADFKGKRVGVPGRGSHGELLFNDMLVDAGLSPNDVVYVAVGGPATAYPALVNRRVDAVVTLSPMDALCEAKNTCRVVLDTRLGEGPASVRESMGAGVPMWMHARYIAAHPGAVKALRLAIGDAETFIRDPANLEEVLAITIDHFLVQAPGVSGVAVTRAALEKALPGYVAEVKLSALKAIARYLTKNGQLPADLDPAPLLLP
jgi:NitT/TauT family transport system substrate-binding protein